MKHNIKKIARYFWLLFFVTYEVKGITGPNFWKIREIVEKAQKERHDREFFYNPAPVKTVYLEQPLDHFDAFQEGTYKQRIYLNEEFWSQGGPVFLYIGGEGTLSNHTVSGGHHYEMAKVHHALLVSAEHRFYGDSLNDDSLQLENLKHLSSQQALADLADVHAYISTKYSLPLNTTWICFGGSYSGALSAWFRLKYPHLVYGAVASSAPVKAQTKFEGYNDVVSKSLSDPTVGGDGECLQQVSQAFIQIDGLIKLEKFEMLEKDFKSCGSISDPKDSMVFVSNLAGNIQGVVQYNNEAQGLNIQKVCGTMITTSDPYKNMMALNQMFMKMMNVSCVDNTYSTYVKSMSDTTVNKTAFGVGIRSWTWQTCTQFGYYQTCDDGTNCPFSRLITLKSFVDLCQDIYKIPTTKIDDFVDFTNSYYGAAHPKGTRIVFVNGSIDPWHWLSILEDESDTELAVFIKGTAHCADMASTTKKDPEPLTDGRKKTENVLSHWLAEARGSHRRM